MRFWLLLLCLQAAAVSAAPRVAVSITPLQELTATIMADAGQPEVIVAGLSDVHHFAFRPSHLRHLQNAQLVIWIDRDFESGFRRLPDILPAETRQLELARELGLKNDDGHIWYSPRLMAQSARAIGQALAEIDPQHSEHYRSRAADLASRLEIWRGHALAQLSTSPPRVLTDHAFLGRFADDFGFDGILALHGFHKDSGSLRELHRLESALDNGSVNCLLAQYSTISPLARKLASKYALRVVDLSASAPTDSAIPPTLRRLEGVLAGFENCRGAG